MANRESHAFGHLECPVFENNPFLIEMYSRCFVESRLESARKNSSTPSATLVLVGHLAAGIRRAAAAVESWANGRVDDVLAGRHTDRAF